MTDRLRQRDLQLDSYVRTNHDLENETRIRQDFESQVQKLESELSEARHTLSAFQMDITRKADQARYTQVWTMSFTPLNLSSFVTLCLKDHSAQARTQG